MRGPRRPRGPRPLCRAAGAARDAVQSYGSTAERAVETGRGEGGDTAYVIDRAAEDTAFGDRSSEWMLSIDSTWHDPAADAANIAYTRAFWDAVHRCR